MTTRTLFALLVASIPLLVTTGFRAFMFRERAAELRDLSVGDIVNVFWVGFRLDGVVISRGCLPVFLLLPILPDAWLPASQGWVLGYLGMVLFIVFIAEAIGIYFFRYYDFRPNYLIFEHGGDIEVLKTVAKAYPVLGIALFGLVGAIAGLVLLYLFYPEAIHGDGSLPWYWDRAGAFAFLGLAGFATRGTLDHRPLNPSFALVTNNRVANEIASCGMLNVLYDWNHRFKGEFTPLKSVIAVPLEEQAIRRAREYYSGEGQLTDDSPNPIVRWVNNERRPEALNVVLVVMESFTARLLGSLGGQPPLSPEFDRLAEQGVLLENCYATGERTIQGLEAVVSSFPPLPGAGVVKRPQAHHGFATLASVLKERDYASLFLYGGQGIFDRMKSFFTANGFDSFIEEKDFLSPRFKSPWGVSDEDLFHRAHNEFLRLHDEGKNFFATILTVSLHSPWEYPAGRIDPLPPGTAVPSGYEIAELNNFLYADFAIGQFMREARQTPYFDNTLFVFVGDHGVHLRGRDLIPVDDYRVGALLFAPKYLRPRRVRRVASQIDLPTTIMGVLGGPYRNPFFGRDILSSRAEAHEPTATVIYNKRRYGIVSERELIVLAENDRELAYRRQERDHDWRSMTPTPAQKERSQRAVAVLKLAEDLLTHGNYTNGKTASPTL